MSPGRKKQDLLAEFRGIYTSGPFVFEESIIPALALLFKKVFFPSHIELVEAFSKKYRITPDISDILTFPDPRHYRDVKVSIRDHGTNQESFPNLNIQQKDTATKFVFLSLRFLHRYKELVPDVFETSLLRKSDLLNFNVEAREVPGTRNKNWRRVIITFQPPINFVEDDTETIPKLINNGYVPVVGKFHPLEGSPLFAEVSLAKQLAALLAMKSVEMVFPRTKPAHPQVILEARDRLSDQLPAFWSAMFKLSVELRERIRDCKSSEEIVAEGQELVDTIVRPALIDLRQKLIKERRQWFYRILSSAQKSLRLLIGNPPLTQQQLLTNALLLGADVAMAASRNLQRIEALKGEAGLTFLLDLQGELDKSATANRKRLANKDAADRRRREGRRG